MQASCIVKNTQDNHCPIRIWKTHLLIKFSGREISAQINRFILVKSSQFFFFLQIVESLVFCVVFDFCFLTVLKLIFSYLGKNDQYSNYKVND